MSVINIGMVINVDAAAIRYELELRSDLIDQVDDYIKSYAPTSKVSADSIVNICIEKHMDITLLLAQAHLESHFGTCGLAKKTNSMFNIGAFDNEKPRNRYSDINECIREYVSVMQSHYLNTRDVDSLIADGFTNKNGYRYASSIDYEKAMRSLIHRVEKETNIKKIQQILNLTHNG